MHRGAPLPRDCAERIRQERGLRGREAVWRAV